MNMNKIINAIILLMVVSIITACGSPSPVFVSNDNSESKSDMSLEIENLPIEGANSSEYVKSSTDVIFVHISGAVVSPGVIELASGDRLFEAVNKAGGFAENASRDYCNLAEELTDGSQYYIPTIEEAAVMTLKSNNESIVSHYSGDGKLNINLATKEELMKLSGIGQARANAIIEYRENNGLFANVADLKNVSGIKENLYSQIESQLCID